MRQWRSRYAIRAGRNLPDKEFRYLRTVIVTAPVYWGFDSKLAPLLLTFQHRAGVRPYTSTIVFAESCVFGKQSLEPLYCNHVQLALYRLTYSWHPFSRSYGAKLHSSLGSVLSRPLVYSTHLPVSVCGTDIILTRYEAFLGSVGSARLWPCGLPITSRR